MTNTEIAELGTLILAHYGLPTHVTVLSPWQPLTCALRTRYLDGKRIARMWQEEESCGVWNVPTMRVGRITEKLYKEVLS